MGGLGSPRGRHSYRAMESESKTSLFKNVLSVCKEWIPVLGGIAGLAALYGFIASFILLPSRVDEAERQNIKQGAEITNVQQDQQKLGQRVSSVEEVNKAQSSEIVEIKNDAIQRRELLATALAMITQINDRTKRMEEYLLNHPRP